MDTRNQKYEPLRSSTSKTTARNHTTSRINSENVATSNIEDRLGELAV